MADRDQHAGTAGNRRCDARAAPAVDTGARPAPDTGADVRFRPRHDHVLMGAAFGIHTDHRGSSSKVVTAPSSPTRWPAARSSIAVIAAVIALLAGAVVLSHALLGWAAWLDRVPGRSSGRTAAITGLALWAVAAAAVVWARHTARRLDRSGAGPTARWWTRRGR
jgi:hypothetical protein